MSSTELSDVVAPINTKFTRKLVVKTLNTDWKDWRAYQSKIVEPNNFYAWELIRRHPAYWNKWMCIREHQDLWDKNASTHNVQNLDSYNCFPKAMPAESYAEHNARAKKLGKKPRCTEVIKWINQDWEILYPSDPQKECPLDLRFSFQDPVIVDNDFKLSRKRVRRSLTKYQVFVILSLRGNISKQLNVLNEKLVKYINNINETIEDGRNKIKKNALRKTVLLPYYLRVYDARTLGVGYGEILRVFRDEFESRCTNDVFKKAMVVELTEREKVAGAGIKKKKIPSFDPYEVFTEKKLVEWYDAAQGYIRYKRYSEIVLATQWDWANLELEKV